MDVSLDDYINKTNFRVQIGNPNYKDPKPGGKPGGGFQLKKIVGPETTVPDVSITVSSVQKPPGVQLNRTNQVRDARERLVARSRPADARDKLKLIQKAQSTDARDKLIQKAQSTDARQKLTNIRARKAQTQGPGLGSAITRTVANKAEVRPGPGGGVQFTRTLSRVMPPGYEDLQAQPLIQPSAAPAPRPLIPPPNQAPPQITRTVYTAPRLAAPPPRPLVPPPGVHIQPAPVPLQYTMTPPIHQLVYHHPGALPPPPFPAPPTHYLPPPGPPQFQAPVPASYMAAPPPPAPYVPPGEAAGAGPPYPTDGPSITRTVTQQVPGDDQITVPVVQVQNDQYQPAPPPAPPYPTQEPPYPYSPPVAPVYQPPPPPPLQRTVPNPPPPRETAIDPGVGGGREPVGVRRRPLGGPLKLSSSGIVPIVDLPAPKISADPYRPRKAGAADEPPVKKAREEVPPVKPAVRPTPVKAAVVDDDSDVISPLQGYKVQVTNLHVSVSQDDIIELFGALGAVKKVRLVKPGVAEVTYVRREDAIIAQTTYHNRELDGLPMAVKVATPANARVRLVPDTLPPSVKPITTGPLKLNKKPAGMARVSDKNSVDVDTLHKALFKTASTTPSKPVTFTVNI